MTLSERESFIPQTARDRAAQEIATAYRGLTELVYTNQVARLEALQKIGNYAEDAARDQWQRFNDSVGDGLTAYNEVVEIISTPCEESWTVLLETALPAAGDALWLLLVPTPGEILENYLSPGSRSSGGKGGRGSRDTERRKGPRGTLRRRWPGIPDVDQLIADNIPGRDAVRGRNAGSPTRWLFRGINIVDAVLWFFLVVDATSTFWQSWSSGLREARFCQNPLDSILSMGVVGAAGGGDICLWENPEDVDIDTAKNWDVEASCEAGLTVGGKGHFGTLTATAAITITDASGDGTFKVGLRLFVDFLGGGGRRFDGPLQTVGVGETAEVGVTADVEDVVEVRYVRRVLNDTGFGPSVTWQGDVANLGNLG